LKQLPHPNFQVLTGQRPFNGGNARAAALEIAQRGHMHLQQPKGMDEQIWNLIQRCLTQPDQMTLADIIVAL